MTRLLAVTLLSVWAGKSWTQPKRSEETAVSHEYGCRLESGLIFWCASTNFNFVISVKHSRRIRANSRVNPKASFDFLMYAFSSRSHPKNTETQNPALIASKFLNKFLSDFEKEKEEESDRHYYKQPCRCAIGVVIVFDSAHATFAAIARCRHNIDCSKIRFTLSYKCILTSQIGSNYNRYIKVHKMTVKSLDLTMHNDDSEH